MANLQQRTGRINVRVGGNTQEFATLVNRTADGRILEKDLQNVSNPVRATYIILYQLHILTTG
jgi:hypothetical protein